MSPLQKILQVSDLVGTPTFQALNIEIHVQLSDTEIPLHFAILLQHSKEGGRPEKYIGIVESNYHVSKFLNITILEFYYNGRWKMISQRLRLSIWSESSPYVSVLSRMAFLMNLRYLPLRLRQVLPSTTSLSTIN